jgi:hypothetical protein
MSSFTVTIEGTTAEPESAFLMQVVREALKAYRHHRSTSDPANSQVSDNATRDAEQPIQSLPIHLVHR